MQHEPFRPSLESIAHTLAYDGAVMGDTMGGGPGPLRRWASVNVKTLLMEGGASPDWQRNGVHALAQVLPDVRRRTLEGQGHGPDSKVLGPVLRRSSPKV